MSKQRALERALQHEREKRVQAEQALENRARELHHANEQLQSTLAQIAAVNLELRKKQSELTAIFKEHSAVTTDLKLAADLQQGMIPARAKFGEFDASGFLVPAMYVAGDAYDYFMLSDNVLAFYMSDVTGHGTSSAMVAYAIHCVLNPKTGGLCRQSLEQSSSLENALITTMGRINKQFLHGVHQNQFFTMVYGLVDINSGDFVLCQAGHPAPVLLGYADGSVTQIGNGGFPVGLFAEADYKACKGNLKRGDKLFIYSDGITDLCNTEGEEFGEGRLLSLLQSSIESDVGETSKSIDHKLMEWIMEWKQDTAPEDDLSVLILNRDTIGTELSRESYKIDMLFNSFPGR